jgi:hypothetical protein
MYQHTNTGRDLNPGRLECRTGMLTTRPRLVAAPLEEHIPLFIFKMKWPVIISTGSRPLFSRVVFIQ